MNKNRLFGKGLAVGIVCFLIILSFPITFAQTDHYEDKSVLVVGKCDTVYGPILWRFGLYIPILKRDIRIISRGAEGEALSIFIPPPGFAVYFSKENISINIQNARGIFFWGGKSRLLNNTPPFLFISCKAQDIWIDSY